MKYRYLEHTADAKFQAFGSTLEEAFENAALAMFNLMVKTEKVKPIIERKINIEANDKESLLYNFLEELLFILDSSGLVLNSFKNMKIRKINNHYELSTLFYGDKIESYEIFGEVKAITYNDMSISKEKDKFIIQAVVDL
jgi:SHS2 domain-containing protein